MYVKYAEFIGSSPDIKKCPKPKYPEYAFVGRSNVGKSSLINMLVNKKNLAKTSSTPGKTKLINHFLVNKEWYLVDLPGYGYAKSSKKNREKWNQLIHEYLLKRENLLYTFILIDARLKPQENDLKFIEWFGGKQIPFVMVFTKSDKTSQQKLRNTVDIYKATLKEYWSELPQFIISSSKSDLGKKTILELVEKTNPLFKLNQ